MCRCIRASGTHSWPVRLIPEGFVVRDRKRVLGRKVLLDDANAVRGEAGQSSRVKTPEKSEVAVGSGRASFSLSQTAGRRTAQVPAGLGRQAPRRKPRARGPPAGAGVLEP